MDDTPRCALDAWIQALEEGRADLAAGRVTDGQAMRQRLRDTIREMEAELEREQQAEPSGLPQP